MLTRWLTQALTAKPLHRLCAWVIQRFWKIPVICTHTHAHKSNPIIRIVRHTLFRDTHVASRSTLFGLGEPALDIKGRCSILFLSLPLPLPVSSGLGFFFFHFLFIAILEAWQKVSVIPPDFIPFCLANVDSPPSSHMSHMESLQLLLCNNKNCVLSSYYKICAVSTTPALPGY